METKSKTLDVVNLFVLIISILVPTIFLIQTYPTEVRTQTYILFGIIVMVFFVGIFVTYIVSKWRNMNKEIQDTKKEVEDIKKGLDFKEMFNKMDVKVKVLEKLFDRKDKKGEMDPRIIIWILLLLLLYLFLKSIGIFG